MLKAINRSLSNKLLVVIAATTLVALALSAIMLVLYDARAYRSATVTDLRAQADILSLSSAPALAFDDHEVATENLATLRARDSIESVALYDGAGERFATYVARGAHEPPQRLTRGEAEWWVEDGRIVLQRDALHQNERLGTIEIRARYEPFARVTAYVGLLVLVMLASVVVALALSARLRGTVTEPIVAMASMARRVMGERNYSLRATRTTDDEIGVLVDAVNGMLAQIEQHAGALEQANRDLQHEMQVRLDAEAALRAADASKDEFLATLAHELRNPLAALSSASQLLSRAPDNPQVSALARETLGRQVEHMARLLEDLLDVSRITRGKLALRKEVVDLRTVIDAAVETSRPVIDAKNHALHIELPPQPVRLVGDALRLAQVIANLLTNAAKYTDAYGRIELLAAIEGHELVIRVLDNGIGIPADALPRIFGMFSQVHSALDRAQGGLGIGLALAKGLVELHGGSISGASAGAGQGAQFTVRLLLSEPVALESPPVRHAEAVAVAPRRILVVDDNADARESLAVLLGIEGHQVQTACDGEEALKMAEEFLPEIVLLDIGMPKLNGYEVAQALRARPSQRGVTLIAVTGWGQREDKRRAAEAGFDHHLVKPIDPEMLRQVIAGKARPAETQRPDNVRPFVRDARR
jgi:signal transduction histidine kinase/ActR/RegA family two-component response regulator